MTLRAEMKQAFCSVEDVEQDDASQSDQSTQLPQASTPAPHMRPNLENQTKTKRKPGDEQHARDALTAPKERKKTKQTMKHLCPIISRECLEPVLDVFPQLGPIVFGELFGAGRGPLGFHTVDAKGGVESINKGGEELGFETAETHPFPVGAGVDIIKGSAAIEGIGSAWCREIGGGAVSVEERERGNVAGARDLREDKSEEEDRVRWMIYHVGVDNLTTSASSPFDECQENACCT